MRASFASVSGLPAIVVTLEDYNQTLWIMNHGPDSLKDVKMKDEDEGEPDQPVVDAQATGRDEVPSVDQDDTVVQDPQVGEDIKTGEVEDVVRDPNNKKISVNQSSRSSEKRRGSGRLMNHFEPC